MKLLNTLKNFPSAQKFLWFSLFFYFSMYLSKTIHALWFEENHALTSFGFSYTMMAVAVILSFFTGKLGDKISPHFALRLGVVIYAVGFRIFFLDRGGIRLYCRIRSFTCDYLHAILDCVFRDRRRSPSFGFYK